MQGLGMGVLEADEHITARDRVAVAHQDLLDQTAFQMLHALAFALHDDHARGDGSAVERSERRPGAEAAEGGGDGRNTRDDPRAGIGGRVDVCRGVGGRARLHRFLYHLICAGAMVAPVPRGSFFCGGANMATT